jgi:hypothetical protein
MGGDKNVRRVLFESSVKDASLWHRVMTLAARFVISVVCTDPRFTTTVSPALGRAQLQLCHKQRRIPGRADPAQAPQLNTLQKNGLGIETSAQRLKPDLFPRYGMPEGIP